MYIHPSTIPIKIGFKPITKWAIKWHDKPLAGGNYKGSDRGIGEDVYESEITFRGTLTELTALETRLDANRSVIDDSDTYNCVFSEGEEVFGMDLDYSSVGGYQVSVIKYGKIRKVAFRVFEMNWTIRLAETPVFLATPAASLASLRKISHADTRESIYDITKHFTYDRDLFALDHYESGAANTGAGTYTTTFSQTNDEMTAIRRYIMTNRATTISPLPDFDTLVYPFGTIAGSGPFDVKIINWEDLGRIDSQEWSLRITFARIF